MENNTDKDKKFTGVYTAIITPFDENGSIDFNALKLLIDFNIENGVSGIVPCGTTGESPTLNDKEHKKVIEFTVSQVNGRVKVLAGTGSNNTAYAVEMTKYAEDAGADGALVVNPYYNKPTQEGLYRHFKAVADSVEIPIVIYNIKGRTCVNVETNTLMRLINTCKNIIAVKEASGDLNQIKDVIKQSPDYFCALSGDDGITLDLIKEGGDGVVSVASNILPKQMCEMVDAALRSDFEKAEALNKTLDPFFSIEFVETNPIPIKAALALKGRIKEVYRLPMCELAHENKQKLMQIMEEMKLL